MVAFVPSQFRPAAFLWVQLVQLTVTENEEHVLHHVPREELALVSRT